MPVRLPTNAQAAARFCGRSRETDAFSAPTAPLHVRRSGPGPRPAVSERESITKTAVSPDRHQQSRQPVKESKLQLLTTALLLCVFVFLGQSTRPMLADGAIVPQHVSYSPIDAISSPSGSMARTKKLKMACYPVGGACARNSDCCTGFCRAGRVTAYCDNN
jgi:hypothetical protein